MVAKISKFRKRGERPFGGVVASLMFAAALIAVTGFFIFQNVTMSQKRSALEERLRELQEQTSALSMQRGVLEATIGDMQTQEYQEKVLREQGLYKKEGEEVITVLPPEAIVETAPTKEEESRKWWNPFTW